jgi:hypothetical protein
MVMRQQNITIGVLEWMKYLICTIEQYVSFILAGFCHHFKYASEKQPYLD